VVSDRAIKHVHELTQIQSQDPTIQCAVLFVVNRSDCHAFTPCDEADPLFANIVKHAQLQGKDERQSNTAPQNSFVIMRNDPHVAVH
jgi:DNA-binding sugar fermentation-stimulating protein